MDYNELLKQFSQPAALIFFIPLVIGMLCKKTPHVPDWLIPWIVTVSGIAIGLLYIGGKVGAGVGFLVSAVSVYGHQMFVQTKYRNADDAVKPPSDDLKK